MQTIIPRQRPLNQNPEAVRRRRLLKGMKQYVLAQAAEISPNHVSGIESGKKSASVGVLHRLAVALECPVEELLAKDLQAEDEELLAEELQVEELLAE